MRGSVTSTTGEADGLALLCLVVANSGHQWEKPNNNLSVPCSDKEAEIWKETAIAPYCLVKPTLKITQKREKSQKQLAAGCNQTV